MNFSSVAFLDTSSFTAYYLLKFRDRHNGDTLPIRTSGKNEAVWDEWGSARNLIAKIESVAPKPMPVSNAYVWRAKPNSIEPWDMPIWNGVRAFLPLIPSPGAMLFSGIEGVNPPIGMLTMVSRTEPFSVVNRGPCSAVWLVVDAALPDRED